MKITINYQAEIPPKKFLHHSSKVSIVKILLTLAACSSFKRSAASSKAAAFCIECLTMLTMTSRLRSTYGCFVLPTIRRRLLIMTGIWLALKWVKKKKTEVMFAVQKFYLSDKRQYRSLDKFHLPISRIILFGNT